MVALKDMLTLVRQMTQVNLLRVGTVLTLCRIMCWFTIWVFGDSGGFVFNMLFLFVRRDIYKAIRVWG